MYHSIGIACRKQNLRKGSSVFSFFSSVALGITSSEDFSQALAVKSLNSDSNIEFQIPKTCIDFIFCF